MVDEAECSPPSSPLLRHRRTREASTFLFSFAIFNVAIEGPLEHLTYISRALLVCSTLPKYTFH